MAEGRRQLRRGEAAKWLTQASLEFRADWQGTWQGSEQNEDETGFRGQFLNIKLAGQFGPHWNWAYRQRLSKDMFRASGYLNATDYLYLQYHPTQRWTITAGKQFIAVGGFEYDYAPIDVYKYSAFCNNVYCYGFGASAAYDLTPHDNLLIQAAQSSFAEVESTEKGLPLNRYSYNVKWTGNHGRYHSLYSVGMHEYDRHKFINILALGNRFDLGPVQLIADYTNRYDIHGQRGFFRDFTIVGQAFVQPIKELNLFAHYTYDRNKANEADRLVALGTDVHTYGLGAEYFPIRGEKFVRLHGGYYYSSTKQHFMTLGLTFRPDFLKLKQQFKAHKRR